MIIKTGIYVDAENVPDNVTNEEGTK